MLPPARRQVAVSRLRQHLLGDIEVVAIIGVNQNRRPRSDRLAHRLDNRDVPPVTRLELHVAPAAPDFDLEGTMAVFVALARMFLR